ncbi:hypothetical protein JCM11641_002187 [Rhodosporidiobolus odoratus]
MTQSVFDSYARVARCGLYDIKNERGGKGSTRASSPDTARRAVYMLDGLEGYIDSTPFVQPSPEAPAPPADRPAYPSPEYSPPPTLSLLQPVNTVTPESIFSPSFTQLSAIPTFPNPVSPPFAPAPVDSLFRPPAFSPAGTARRSRLPASL